MTNYMTVDKECMQFLQSDIIDIQVAIEEISSNEQLNLPGSELSIKSWKFPYKEALTIDIDGLLCQYSYNPRNVEENIRSHIALLELLIDRYFLFSFLLLKLISHLKSKYESSLPNDKISPRKNILTNSSVGLVVRQLFQELCKLMKFLNTEHVHNSPRTANNSMVLSLPTFSVEKSTIFTQTSTSAFVPCTSCARVQESSMSVADVVINLCKSQKIPSAVQKFLSLTIDSRSDWMSAMDIMQYHSELVRDVKKISKHFLQLVEHLEQSKEYAIKLQAEIDKLNLSQEKNDRKMQEEKNKLYSKISEWQNKYYQQEEQNNKTKSELRKSRTEIEKCNHVISGLKEEIRCYRARIDNLITENDDCKQAFERKLEINSLDLVNKNKKLEQQVNDLKEKLEYNMKEKAELVAKSEFLEKNEHLLEKKLNNLTTENSKLELMLKEKSEYEQKYLTIKQNYENCQDELQKTSKQIKEYIEKNAELQKKLENAKPTEEKIATSGNLIDDMKRQIEFNQMKVDKLKAENIQLTISLQKLCENTTFVEPNELIYPSPRIEPEQNDSLAKSNNSARKAWANEADDSDTASFPEVANDFRPPKVRIEKNFNVNKMRNLNTKSAIAAYKQLKNSSSSKSPVKSSSAASSRTNKWVERHSNESAKCRMCSKTYNDVKDLEIHYLYCTGSD